MFRQFDRSAMKVRRPRRSSFAIRPAYDALEGRQLLSVPAAVSPLATPARAEGALVGRATLDAALRHHRDQAGVPAHVIKLNYRNFPKAKQPGPTVTVIGHVAAGSYEFTNFDGPLPANSTAASTTMLGISNRGTTIGYSTDLKQYSNYLNFTANPLKSNSASTLTFKGLAYASADAINSAGTVVGGDENDAFYESRGRLQTFIPPGGTYADAFGINDRGTIVGNYSIGNAGPGFIRVNANRFITINPPSDSTDLNATGINNNGLVVGYYYYHVGPRYVTRGFLANEKSARNGAITATPIPDPTIPHELGATVVFSVIYGVNDKGIAVGDYEDSLNGLHGFLYNTKTGQYTFLDDPSGRAATSITGITDSGEITGDYFDRKGLSHGFVAVPIKH
jgi:uncharacterized membrane protein